MNRIDRAAQYEHETGKEYLETKETLIPYHYTEWLEMKLSASDAALTEAEERNKAEMDKMFQDSHGGDWSLQSQLEEVLEIAREFAAWMGAPPTGPYDFDSAREDTWKRYQAFLSRQEEGRPKSLLR